MKTNLHSGLLVVLAVLAGSQLSCAPEPTPQSRRTTARPGEVLSRAASARRYRIRFDRPFQPGARYKIDMSGTMDTETVLNGKPVGGATRTEGFAYVAEVTVKALHPCGKSTREVHRIRKAERTLAGALQVMLPPGTTVLAESVGGKDIFSVGGKPVSAAIGKFLDHVVSLYDGDTNSTDDIYDPVRPRAVGETWKVNATKMIRGLKKSVKVIATWPKPSEVEGTVTLVAVRRVQGVEMLELKAETRMPNVIPKMKLPVKSGALAFTNTFRIPADPRSRAPIRASLTLQITLEISSAPLGTTAGTMIINVLQGRRATITPLP